MNKLFLNNFRWVPDSCHREEGKNWRELFEKARVNTMFSGSEEGGLFEKGFCQKSPFSLDSRDSREFGESPDFGQ